jgi:hypothetical protein
MLRHAAIWERAMRSWKTEKKLEHVKGEEWATPLLLAPAIA